MSYIYHNENPFHNLVGDCVIRAISLANGTNWDTTYLGIISTGYELKDMPSSNSVWATYLKKNGFGRYIIPDTCPACYTIKDFCVDHQTGTYILATGSHVVTVIDGDYYDTWDSGNEVPIYYFKKET